MARSNKCTRCASTQVGPINTRSRARRSLCLFRQIVDNAPRVTAGNRVITWFICGPRVSETIVMRSRKTVDWDPLNEICFLILVRYPYLGLSAQHDYTPGVIPPRAASHVAICFLGGTSWPASTTWHIPCVCEVPPRQNRKGRTQTPALRKRRFQFFLESALATHTAAPK